MLYYVPLEMLKERYTWQWSAPVTGWLERNWIKAGIEYQRIDGIRAGRDYIGKGVILDAVSRSTFCFSQIEQLLALADMGLMTSNDVIYMDDFWTPGLESLPYLFDQIGIRPRIYSFLFAQSVDVFDFTFKMKHWIRPIEAGYGQIYDGIFVAHPLLKELVVDGKIASADKVHVTGHPYSSEEVKGHFPKELPLHQDKVVFSSRWDDEKDPCLFLTIAEKVLQRRPRTKFVVCTGSKRLRSNNPANIEALRKFRVEHPNALDVRVACTKEQYYEELLSAKVQINTALQDFVPLTLLEASTAGAYPVYPDYRSFPDTFRKSPLYLYPDRNPDAAAALVVSVLDRSDLWTESAIKEREWIHTRYDHSWKRQLRIMGLYDQPETEEEGW